MSAEANLLNHKDIKLAQSSMLTRGHPVVGLLRRNYERLTNVGQETFGKQESRKQWFRNTYAFLVEDLMKLEDFSLSPLDLIAIWSSLVDVVPLNARYEFAKVLGLRYILQGLDEKFGNIQQFDLISGKNDLPKAILEDEHALRTIYDRLNQIYASTQSIYNYPQINTTEDEIKNAASISDQKARKMLYQQGRFTDLREAVLFYEIPENMSNGLSGFSITLTEALYKLNK